MVDDGVRASRRYLNQPGAERVSRHPRPEGAGAAPLPDAGAPATAPVTLLAAAMPPGRGRGPAYQALLRQTQPVLGNRAVQRLLKPQASPSPATTILAQAAEPEEDTLQRTPSVINVDGEEEILQRAPDVPGLSKTTETTAKALLSGSATDKQKAIDAVVTNMVKNGEFSLSKIKDKQVKYNSSTVGEGLTSTSFPGGKASESLMEIGDAAFASLGWLYSSILHEYKHVQQHFALKKVSDWDEDYAEVEAYAREIKKAKDTGAYSNKGQMEDLWTRLHDNYWINITDAKKKKKLNSLVKEAHKIAEKATGKKLTLTL